MANAASASSASGWSSGQGRLVTRYHDGPVIHVGGCISATSFPAMVTLRTRVRQLRLLVLLGAPMAGWAAWAAGAQRPGRVAARRGTPGPDPPNRGLRVVPCGF